jgi:hypothetical protein
MPSTRCCCVAVCPVAPTGAQSIVEVLFGHVRMCNVESKCCALDLLNILCDGSAPTEAVALLSVRG